MTTYIDVTEQKFVKTTQKKMSMLYNKLMKKDYVVLQNNQTMLAISE